MVDKNLNYTLAKKAFSYVANYDASISNHLGILKTDNTKNKMPDTLTLHFEKAYDLRYGENPHQDASFLFKKILKRLVWQTQNNCKVKNYH